MGGLFERYRRIEGLRSEALALLVDRYATVVARVRGAAFSVGGRMQRRCVRALTALRRQAPRLTISPPTLHPTSQPRRHLSA
jgi:hypothetical protein